MAAFVRGVIEPVGEIERFYSSSVEGSWYTVVPDTKKNVHKVQVFWKGHTYLKKNLYLLWCYQVNVKEKWKIVTNSCSLFRISELWMEKKVDCRKLWLRSYKVEGQTWIVCFLALWWRLLSKPLTNTQSLIFFSNLMGTPATFIQRNDFTKGV